MLGFQQSQNGNMQLEVAFGDSLTLLAILYLVHILLPPKKVFSP